MVKGKVEGEEHEHDEQELEIPMTRQEPTKMVFMRAECYCVVSVRSHCGLWVDEHIVLVCVPYLVYSR
jgi:hypothetical protein